LFWYSGHGASVADQNGDEADGKDECIVTGDQVVVRDETLKPLLVDSLGPLQKMLAVFDCCHASTILDLTTTVEYDSNGDLLRLVNSSQVLSFAPPAPPKPSSIGTLAMIGLPLLGLAMATRGSSGTAVMVVVIAVLGLYMSRRRPASQVPASRSSSPRSMAPRVLCLSACRDPEYAYESPQQGFFTEELIKVLSANSQANMQTILLTTGRAIKQRGVHQHPTVSFDQEASL
jgi:hypothetical protein